MTEVKEIAYGRVGLLGNPSDLFGGKCIAFTVNRFSECKVKIESSDRFELQIKGLDVGGNNLIAALFEYLTNDHRFDSFIDAISEKSVEVSIRSNVPVGAGLAGSTAIIVACIRCLISAGLLDKLEKWQIAELALKVEVKQLGIMAGFQDRYAVVYQGVHYMDFTGKSIFDEEPKQAVLKPVAVPYFPFFLCFSHHPKSSATVHNPLMQKYVSGNVSDKRKIDDCMLRIADIAEKGVESIESYNLHRLGKLMNENTELRTSVGASLATDLEIVERAMGFGALGAKTAGSGGAVVVLSDKQSVLLDMMREYPCMIPSIV